MPYVRPQGFAWSSLTYYQGCEVGAEDVFLVRGRSLQIASSLRVSWCLKTKCHPLPSTAAENGDGDGGEEDF